MTERDELKIARVAEDKRLLEMVDQPRLTASTIVALGGNWPEARKLGHRGGTK